MNWHRIRHYPYRRAVRHLYQRLTRGWDDSQTYSLDYSLGQIIAPRLSRLKEINNGYPDSMTPEEWNAKLDKMIAAFEFAGSERRWEAGPEEFEKHNEGLKLFAEHYWQLWW